MLFAQQSIEEKDDPGSRIKYYYELRSYPYDKIPQGARRKALELEKNSIPTFSQLNEKRNSLQSIKTWKCIGPNEVGGRVNAIAVHPTDGKTIWCATADGGVWKSTNRGDNWSPQMQNENAISMGSIACSKSNPDILYAGTGEQTSNIDAYEGAGLFKSIDGGNSWQLVGLTTLGAISKVIINPTDPNKIYVASTKNNGGVYKSDNSGLTFTKIYGEPSGDVIANPKDWNEIWIASFSKGVFYSNNGGSTLEERRIGIGSDGETLGRISLAIPNDASIVYAVSYESKGTDGKYSYIYSTVNKGKEWQKIYSGGNFMGEQGWYNNCISVKPDNPKILIAGGQTSMVRSIDGGKNWNTTGSGVHADHHCYEFDPLNTNILYHGNDGGMYRSENAGEGFSEKNNLLAITQFYGICIDQKANGITYGGTQDNGTVKNFSVNAAEIYGGDGFYVAIDPKNSNILYVENPFGAIVRVNLQTGERKGLSSGLSAATQDYANWSAPLLVDPIDNKKIFSGREKVYISLNSGDDWIAASPVIRSNGKVSAIGISSLDNNIIVAGANNGAVIITKDGGESWSEITFKSGMPNRAINDFSMSNKNKNLILMSCSGFFTGHIYKSSDLGESWQDISKGLPDIPVTAITTDLDDENIIYAGTDIGMYITVDGGKTWASFNEGLPRVGVVDLEIYKNTKTLRMASHGRSMWEIELEKSQTTPEVVKPTGGEVWMGGIPQLISWNGFVGSTSVKLEYSLDNGVKWVEIAKNVGGNDLRWNVPNYESEFTRIRVTSEQVTEETATSRSFTLTKFKQGGVIASAGKPMITYGIGFDGEYLYTTDFASNLMLKLDPNNFETKEEIKIKGAANVDSLFTDLAYFPDRKSFFVHKLQSTTVASKGWLYEMDLKGNIKKSYRSNCDYPIGLAWLGDNTDTPYLLASDRNGKQEIYLLDPDNGNLIVTLPRLKIVENGPRGACSSPFNKNIFYQVITDFTGGSLQKTTAEELSVEDGTNKGCIISLDNIGSNINARGIEFDPRDKNFWISDYSGNIYKVISCDSKPIGGVEYSNIKNIPKDVKLFQNNPNPFANNTNISFEIPNSMQCKVIVSNLNGKLISIVSNKKFEKGIHNLIFDSIGIPSGNYTYSIIFENGSMITKNMIYIK